MRGHIRKRSQDSYTIVLELDRENGKRKQQWVTVRGTKRDAEKRLAELLHQRDSGIYVKPGKTTLSEYLPRWLEEYAKPNLSPRGYERYAGIIRSHIIPDMGKLPLAQLRPEHLQKHYMTRINNVLSIRTVRYHHAVLHIALQTAVKWGLLGRNVADAITPPKARRNEMQTWNESELNLFLETAKSSQYYALFYLALFTGMRRSELLALRWQDIDFVYSQLYVNRSLHHLKDGSYLFTQPKTDWSRRTIALPPSATLLLQNYQTKQKLERAMLGVQLTDDDLVFSNVERQPLRPNTITYAWGRIAARAGVKVIRLHDARHTHATLMLKQGIHPKIVQERLGHASIQMTLDTYSHVAPGLQEAAALRFDDIINHRAELQAVKSDG